MASLFLETNVFPPSENRIILISFLPVLVQKGVPSIPVRHCSSTVFLGALKSIITTTARQSAPGLISFAPTQHFLSTFYAESLEAVCGFRALQPVFWVEQLMTSLGLHWPQWGMVFPLRGNS